MRNKITSIFIALAFSLAGASQTTAQSAVERVRYGALPISIQRLVVQQRTECESSTPVADIAAYRLDVNGDDHADFLFPPSAEMTGTAGYCTANWVPVLLWTFNGSGGYTELVLGSDNWLFNRGQHFLATSDCDDDLKWNGVGFAIVARDGSEIVGFGRCFADAEALAAEASSLGFAAISLEE